MNSHRSLVEKANTFRSNKDSDDGTFVNNPKVLATIGLNIRLRLE